MTTKSEPNKDLIAGVLAMFCAMFVLFAVVFIFVKSFIWWGTFFGILAFICGFLAKEIFEAGW